ncbi:MAG: hypothetical protein B1H11_08240 [Desulfobacteraceae bacterium 4484_190.1]|nr:MAG: hypothetical protein B1H11_08240 [Desulfobacteraceae bacterium 4484_190.1]
MVCTSVREGYDCFFMSKKGCQFNGGTCHPAIEQCSGCENIKTFPTGDYCLMFPDPSVKWRTGNCNMATHLQETTAKRNMKINPLKASKRKSH